mgnify:CR=1 FL=1
MIFCSGTCLMNDYTNQIDKYLRKLFPIARSITGNGNRQTLKILQQIIPLEIIEYPSGLEVYDWVIPDEWNINDAWIKDSLGNKIIKFSDNNLHVVSYSTAVNMSIDYDELIKRLHFIKEKPNAIPYRTSYYKKDWGFCITYNQFKSLFKKNEKYHIFIDSSLIGGSLSLGELNIKGKSDQEYLISSYICHPSMANDSLSGVITSAFLAKYLLSIQSSLGFSYRFVFLPETIGPISYIYHNKSKIKKIRQGMVVTTCGGPGRFGYKKSVDSDNEINSMVEDVFSSEGLDYIRYPFDIRGSDERQYSSQGVGINCISIFKDKYYEYKEYHTSLDDLSFVKAEYINKTITIYIKLIAILDMNITLVNNKPNCEPMLGRYGLYSQFGGDFLPTDKYSKVDLILWLLLYSDGETGLYSISKKLDIDINKLVNLHKSNNRIL